MCGSEPCEECKEKGCEDNIKVVQRLDSLNYKAGVFNGGGDDVDIEKFRAELDKLYASTGIDFGPPLLTPTPDPGDVPQRVPSFVAPQDKLLVWLATLMYKPLPIEIPGATMDTLLTNSRIGVWTNATTAYVAFRGTDVGAADRAEDLFDDLAIATGATCDLSITIAGIQVLTKLYNKGFTDIHICGHSLGGRGALCCSVLPGVRKVVVINAAAPFLKLNTIGAGPSVATHYHIFGDMISSHMQGVNNVRVRVGIQQYAQRNNALMGIETLYQVNWLDPYYHSTERFLTQDYWEYSTPQEEQNSLETFFFSTQRGAIELLSLLASTVGGQFASLLKRKICENPIPGSAKYRFCRAETSWMQSLINTIMDVLGFLSGAALAILKLQPPKKIVSWGLAGVQGVRGNLLPILKEIFPAYDGLTKQAQGLFLDIVVTITNVDSRSTEDLSMEDLMKKALDSIEPMLPTIAMDEPAVGDIPESRGPAKKPSLVNSIGDESNRIGDEIIDEAGEVAKKVSDAALDDMRKRIENILRGAARKVYKRVEERVKTTITKIEYKIDTYLSPDGEKLPMLEAIRDKRRKATTNVVNKAKANVEAKVKDKADKVTNDVKSKARKNIDTITDKAKVKKTVAIEKVTKKTKSKSKNV